MRMKNDTMAANSVIGRGARHRAGRTPDLLAPRSDEERVVPRSLDVVVRCERRAQDG